MVVVVVTSPSSSKYAIVHLVRASCREMSEGLGGRECTPGGLSELDVSRALVAGAVVGAGMAAASKRQEIFHEEASFGRGNIFFVVLEW